jgi:hypothetical protein
MSTTIYFAAPHKKSALSVVVDTAPEDVQRAWHAADGTPFRLPGIEGGEVWINPSAVVYWQQTPGSST